MWPLRGVKRPRGEIVIEDRRNTTKHTIGASGSMGIATTIRAGAWEIPEEETSEKSNKSRPWGNGDWATWSDRNENKWGSARRVTKKPINTTSWWLEGKIKWPNWANMTSTDF